MPSLVSGDTGPGTWAEHTGASFPLALFLWGKGAGAHRSQGIVKVKQERPPCPDKQLGGSRAGHTSNSTYAHVRSTRTYVDSGIGLVKTPTGVREQP